MRQPARYWPLSTMVPSYSNLPKRLGDSNNHPTDTKHIAYVLRPIMHTYLPMDRRTYIYAYLVLSVGGRHRQGAETSNSCIWAFASTRGR
jgi:hypothetical protein